jgi:hypothetical protein
MAIVLTIFLRFTDSDYPVYPRRIFIKVPVPNRDIELSSIFVLRVSILLLDFGADSTVRDYLYFIYSIIEFNLIIYVYPFLLLVL